MFLQVSVILFTGGGARSRRGVTGPGEGQFLGGSGPRGGVWWRLPRTATAAGSMHSTGMHSYFQM